MLGFMDISLCFITQQLLILGMESFAMSALSGVAASDTEFCVMQNHPTGFSLSHGVGSRPMYDTVTVLQWVQFLYRYGSLVTAIKCL